MFKLFYDSEFTKLRAAAKFISLGFVTENNEKFYAEFTDYDKENVDDWLKKNVIKHLIMPNPKVFSGGNIDWHKDSQKEGNEIVIGNSAYIKERLISWLDKLYKDHGKLEVWSDCLSYDWILLCGLLSTDGTALTIPESLYYIPMDICTLFRVKGVDPDISREDFAGIPLSERAKHNSGFDAEVIKRCYYKLMT